MAMFSALNTGQKLRAGMRCPSLPKSESLPFGRAKMTVECIFAGQFNGPRTV